MQKILSSQAGFIPLLAMGLIAFTGAGIGTAYYLDNADHGRGVEFSLFDSETADSVHSAGEQNRMMAEAMTDRYLLGLEAAQRENRLMAESLTDRYIVAYDQMQANLIKSEQAHRATIQSGNNLLILLLVGIAGLLAWLFISAARHPRNLSAGLPHVTGTPEAYRLEDGSVLFIDGHGQKMISRPKDPVGLLRNQSGNADPVMMTTLVGCIGIALIVALMAGSEPTPVVTGPDNTEEIRMMAERLHADSMAQIDRMAGYMAQAYQGHIESLRVPADRGGLLVIGALCGFMGIMVAFLLFFLMMNRKPRNSDFCHVSGPGYPQIGTSPVHRIERHTGQMPAERQALLSHYGFNERGNVRLILLAGICFCMGLLIFMVSVRAGGIGGKAQAQETAHTVEVESDLMAVIPVFFRNPKGGRPVEAVFVYRSNGEVIRIDPSKVAVAMQAIGAGAAPQQGGVRQMKGGIR